MDLKNQNYVLHDSFYIHFWTRYGTGTGKKKIYQQMFIAALFIITKTGKQLKCLSVSKWRNKLWYLQTMEYYSELKIHELLRHG